MKLVTILIGCSMITMFIVLVSGLSESLMFADFVGIRWANQSSNNDGYAFSFITSSQHQLYVYGIVIDAGSTGTRIHIYKFRYESESSKPLYHLEEETVKEIRPGLSSYASDPHIAREGLDKLLKLASRIVPLSLHRLTHVTLRATAGLRLLKHSEAEALLKEANECIKASGFIVDRVEVMEGLEEAVQAWVTVNYLLHRLRSPQLSFGVMDLGGASTQITFVPMDKRTLEVVPKSHRHNLTIGGQTLDLYTHSYLGLGLMSARLALLTAGGGVRGSEIVSACVPHNYQGHWTHGGVRYSIKSATISSNTSVFDECYDMSRALVTELSAVVHMPEMRRRRFYLFSYFYDRVKDSGLDPDNLPLGEITVDKYRQLARNVCSSTNHSVAYRKPFLCLDLSYIYALLKDGYGLESGTSFQLSKKINNIELGWSLGVVFDLLYRTELV